jgi:acyl dehydratase
MPGFHVEVGDRVSFRKTVAESDVYLFAGITGDFSGNHVDEEYMRRSRYGRRIAHGALLVGFMSTTSTMMIERSVRAGIDETPVSLGYDRIRFLAPVYLGDTIEVVYTIESIDPERRRSTADISIKVVGGPNAGGANAGVPNAGGELVAVGKHILKWVSNG